jgi:ATP/maltotriose-dependent transcriptional regulator MalT
LLTDANLLAVRDALSRHDWQRGYDAARAAQCLDPSEDAERLDLLADSAWWLGRLEECIESRQSAFHGYEELGDHRSAGQCALWLYEHHCMRAQPSIANGWLRRARRLLDGDSECLAFGALLLREAEAAHGAGAIDGAVRSAEEARSLARRLGSADLEAEALQTLGRLLIDSGDATAGLAHLDEAMLFIVEGRLRPYSMGKVYCSLISACEELGDLLRAAEWTDAAARWAKQHPFAIFPGICRVHRAVVLDRRGELAEAEREATRASTELIASHTPNAAAALAEAGDIRRRLGDLAGAEAAFAEAERLSSQTCPGASLLRLAQGDLDGARRAIETCLTSQEPGRPTRARTLTAAVQVCIAAHALDAAETSARELEALAERHKSPLIGTWALVARGRMQLAANAHDEACATLRYAIQQWLDLDVPYEVASTRTLLGQALRGSGDEAGALAAFREARALFERIGAKLDATGREAASHPYPAGLTGREVEVLRLIANGRSNKEVATELHLSPKTVSRHLSNIFLKAGVSSRAAATAFAFQHGVVDRSPTPH